MKNKLALIIILLFAFFLRFWRLDQYPALNADEAAIGYNAYSLIQTGADEHENSWPIHFQSFNDYKPGLYFYLVLPFVKFFGLNEWSVRIPGAFLGVATIYLLYIFIRELKIKNSLVISNLKLEISEVAAFFLAISPWHIHFSRGGWEVNTATFFIVLGVYLFLKAAKKSNLALFELCALSFALSLYTYHAARIVVPLLGIGLLIIYRNEVSKNFKNILLAGLVGLVAISPLVKDLIRVEIGSRAGGVGLFADTGPLSRVNEQRGEHSDYTGLPAKILHNKVVNYGLTFLENWAEHFHGEFLFLSGDDIQRNKVPETGQMYMFDSLWLVIGGWWLVKNPFKGTKLIFWWLIVAPVAAALTFQSPHALRSQNMVIPLSIISSLGLAKVINWIKTRGSNTNQPRGLICIRTLGIAFIFILILWGFVRYQHMYWIHMAKDYPYSSQYGIKELVSYIGQNQDKYEKIIISDRYDQPYILFLFYLQYPPERFQQEHELAPRDKFGFSTVRGFSKFEFRPISFDADQRSNSNSLIVGTSEEIPNQVSITKEIYGSNGYKYFEVVAN